MEVILESLILSIQAHILKLDLGISDKKLYTLMLDNLKIMIR